jgi:hypothetical protein
VLLSTLAANNNSDLWGATKRGTLLFVKGKKKRKKKKKRVGWSVAG